MKSPPHSSYVTFESPDLAYWHLLGRVEAADIKRIYEKQLEFCKDKPFILVLIDVSRLENITPEARRIAAEGPDPSREAMPVRGNVVIGASFHFRVLGTLIDKAARLIHRSLDNPLHFTATEAEARAWIEERRRELQQRA
ncbi:MAG: hypothetical protein IPM54_30825 [Polyangiaceae bacterium]|nr:hypothetical protein [Polyangiaceae bacterium]